MLRSSLFKFLEKSSRHKYSGPTSELVVLQAGRGGCRHDGRALLRPQRQPRGAQHDAGGAHQGHHLPPGEVWQGSKGGAKIIFHGEISNCFHQMLNLSMTSSCEGCDLREKEPVPLMPLLGHLAFNSAVLSHFATNLEQLEMSAFQ